ncbi:ATP-binding protein [Pedobacter sp. AW31-3R]|uniref:ATP-binding protein n=1 Tax=Pedobacter sp. AW31-3R TaxID=3445781 RepID=UPI003F9F04E9
MKTRNISITTISLIIILCIAALFKTSLDQYAEQNSLRSTSELMTVNSKQISRLDTISMSLSEAENDYRIYTTSWKKEYFAKYNAGIKRVSVLLEKFSKENQIRNASENIHTDLLERKKQLLLYVRIKRLTDSLMFINLQMDSTKTTGPIHAILPLKQQVVKQTVKMEEVKSKEPAKKTRLFQRLKSAILNKEQKSDSIKTSKVETTYEKSAVNSSTYSKKQLEKIEKYYRNLFEQQQKNHLNLTEKEKSILKLNEQILQNIKLIFQEFSNREREIAESRKTDLKNKSLHAIDVIDRSGKIHLLVNVISLAMIVFLLIKLYYAYNRILKAKKAAEEQVIFKSRFFTSLSHEMRTPLNAIIGVTEQLKSTPLNAQQQTMSVLLENSSSMLLSAVNEVLDFSRLETGKLSLSHTPFYYKSVSSEIISATAILAEQKGLVLKLNQEQAPDLLLTGDPYRLKQLIMNLVANAIKFSDQGEINVNVAAQEVDSSHIILKIQVQDTGIGIAAKDLPYIFDEFSQVIHQKRNDWQKGSGLGLPICKKLVELHRGKIWATSLVNQGTTFFLDIPYTIAPENAEMQTIETLLPLHTEAFKKIRLLIVDDAEINLIVIKMILGKHGIAFETARNGEEAFELFQDKDFEMILTDIEMPLMDGIELTKKVRAHHDPKKAGTPVIAITGQVSPESHQSYLVAGLNDYLVKPYTEKELLEKILDYLQPAQKK